MPDPTPSETPKTDALLANLLEKFGEIGPINAPERWVEHARDLERENAELRRDKELLDGLEKLTTLSREETIVVFAPQVPGEEWQIEHSKTQFAGGVTFRAAISDALATKEEKR